MAFSFVKFAKVLNLYDRRKLIVKKVTAKRNNVFIELIPFEMSRPQSQATGATRAINTTVRTYVPG